MRKDVARSMVRLSKCILCNVWVIICKVGQVCYMMCVVDSVWRWWCIIRISANLVSSGKLVALSSIHWQQLKHLLDRMCSQRLSATLRQDKMSTSVCVLL